LNCCFFQFWSRGRTSSCGNQSLCSCHATNRPLLILCLVVCSSYCCSPDIHLHQIWSRLWNWYCTGVV